MKIEKRNENTILQLEREKYESFLLEIETLVNDWIVSLYLCPLQDLGLDTKRLLTSIEGAFLSLETIAIGPALQSASLFSHRIKLDASKQKLNVYSLINKYTGWREGGAAS